MRKSLVLVATIVSLLCVAHAATPAGYFYNPQIVPPDSFIAASIKDCPAVWKAIKSSPLYAEYQKLMKTPPIANSIKYKEFQLEMKKAELELGFPLNADTLLGQIVKGIDVAIRKPKAQGEKPTSCLVFYLADVQKAQKLVAYAEKKALEPPKPVGTTPPAATPAQVKINTETYKGFTLKTPSTNAGSYCFAGDAFVYSSTPAALKEAIDRLKGEVTTSLAQQPDLQKASKYINPAAYQCMLYWNQSGFMSAMGAASPAMSTVQFEWLNKSFGAMPFVMGVNVSPTNIRMDSFTAYDPQSSLGKTWQLHAPQAQFAHTSFIPSFTLFAALGNTLDGVALYDLYYTTIANMLGALTPPGYTTPAQDPKAKLDEAIKKFETEVGFKIRDDFFASIGPEFALSLNSLKFQMPFPIPVIDFCIVLQTRDRAKVASLMTQLERYVNKKIAQASGLGGQGTTPPALTIQFQEIEHFGTKIRYLSFPQFPMYSPCYAFSDGNVIIGLTLDGVKNVLDCKQGRMNSFAASEQFKVAQSYLPGPYNGYTFINVAAIVDTIKNVIISQNPNYQQQNDAVTALAVFDAIKVMPSIHTATHATADGMVSNSVILVKSP